MFVLYFYIFKVCIPTNLLRILKIISSVFLFFTFFILYIFINFNSHRTILSNSFCENSGKSEALKMFELKWNNNNMILFYGKFLCHCVKLTDIQCYSICTKWFYITGFCRSILEFHIGYKPSSRWNMLLLISIFLKCTISRDNINSNRFGTVMSIVKFII